MAEKAVKTLKRFGHKGQFVKYPAGWRPTMRHTGKRRYDTYCDLIVGYCACGDRHSENNEWVQEMLKDTRCRIETHEEWLKRIRKETAVA